MKILKVRHRKYTERKVHYLLLIYPPIFFLLIFISYMHSQAQPKTVLETGNFIKLLLHKNFYRIFSLKLLKIKEIKEYFKTVKIIFKY